MRIGYDQALIVPVNYPEWQDFSARAANGLANAPAVERALAEKTSEAAAEAVRRLLGAPPENARIAFASSALTVSPLFADKRIDS
jgi:hypothetical protein